MTSRSSWAIFESPLGPLTLLSGSGGVSALRFPGAGGGPPEAADHAPARFGDALQQLEEYFEGRLRSFDLPLDLAGTPFQLAVWRRLLAIPFGTTTTYGAIARELGRPDRARAVGAAVGRTPVPIVVPCHRVIGGDGGLTGYGGGLERKRALLELERRAVGAEPPPRQLALL